MIVIASRPTAPCSRARLGCAQWRARQRDNAKRGIASSLICRRTPSVGRPRAAGVAFAVGELNGSPPSRGISQSWCTDAPYELTHPFAARLQSEEFQVFPLARSRGSAPLEHSFAKSPDPLCGPVGHEDPSLPCATSWEEYGRRYRSSSGAVRCPSSVMLSGGPRGVRFTWR